MNDHDKQILINNIANDLSAKLNKHILKVQKKYGQDLDLLATVNANAAAVALGTAVASTCFHAGITSREGQKQLLESMMEVAALAMQDALNEIAAQNYQPNEPLKPSNEMHSRVIEQKLN